MEGVLDTLVFAGGLEQTTIGVFPQIGDVSSDIEIVRDILELIKDVLGRIVGIQNSGTGPGMEDETMDPPLIVRPIVEEEINPMVTIIATTSGALKINTGPQMPAATFRAEMSGLDGEGFRIEYDWSATLHYVETGRRRIGEDMQDVTHNHSKTIPINTLTDPDNPLISSWTIPLGLHIVRR